MKNYIFYTLISAAMVPTVSIASKPTGDDHSVDPRARITAKEQAGGYAAYSSPFSLEEAKKVDLRTFTAQKVSFQARLDAEAKREQEEKAARARLAAQKEKSAKELAELTAQLQVSQSEEKKLRAASKKVTQLEKDIVDVQQKLVKTEKDKASFSALLEQNRLDLKSSQEEVARAKAALQQAEAGARDSDTAKQEEITALRKALADKEAVVNRREGFIATTQGHLDEASEAFARKEAEAHRLAADLLREQHTRQELEESVRSLTEKYELLRTAIYAKDPKAAVPAAKPDAGAFNSDDEDTNIGGGNSNTTGAPKTE
jgi:chromosome segregation ATPase